MKNLLFLAIFCLSANAAHAAAEPPTAPAKVEAITVYLQGAKISGTATLNTPAGVQELVVTNLTNDAIQQSLQVSLKGAGVQLLSTTYRVNNLKQIKVSVHIKVLTDSLELLADQNIKISNQIATFNDEEQIIKKTAENRLGGTDKGASFEDVQKIAEYYQKRLNEIRDSRQKLNKTLTKQQNVVNNINQELSNLNSLAEKAVGEIVLKVKAETATSVTVGFSIVTNSASWTPIYDLKAADFNKPLKLVYKANITQSTGYDWTNVKLKVSTGNPNVNNSRPILVPRYIDLVPLPQPLYDKQEAANAYKQKAEAKPQEKIQDNLMQSNMAYSQSIVIDAPTNGATYAWGGGDVPLPNDSGVAVEIDVAEMQDIPTDSQPHLVQVESYDIPAVYEYHSVPRKEQAAFLLAKITNFGQYNLVRGTANLFFADTYIGQSDLNPNIVSDTLLLSLGRDEKVAIKREQLKDFSSVKFLSNTRRENIGFEIIVRNNKPIPIDIEILDNVPLSQDEEITVEIEEMSGATFTKDNGKLLWDLHLNANETKKLRIVYTIKYPKNRRANISETAQSGNTGIRGSKGMMRR
jgi:uncharacterized protein (TIGR02231 family)